MAAYDQGQTGPGDPEEPVIRDKRKIDPTTGEPRHASDDVDGLIQAEGPDIELSDEDSALLAEAERDLVAEYRDRAARAEAELKNFRTRVERDRAANREAVIAEVIRTLLPAIDDLDRFERYGLRGVGEVGEAFDPQLHEAIVQLPTAGVTVNTVADVIEPGYVLGERLIRAAKVAVSVPE
jgi:molecular chaperone GrpE